MLAIPDIAAAPHRIGVHGGNPLVARMALTFADDTPSRGIRVKPGYEAQVLTRQLEAWHANATTGMRAGPHAVHLALREGGYSLWLGNDPEGRHGPFGTMWTLAPSWKSLEDRAPGLAAAALIAINRASDLGLRVYTPSDALDIAIFTWWHGEEDERMVLEEHREIEGATEATAAPDGLVTRAMWDRAVPRAVTRPKPMPRKRLAQLAAGRGEHAEIAAAVLALQADARRRQGPIAFHAVDGEMHCVHYSATLFWDRDDPMDRVFDDYVHEMAECVPCEPAIAMTEHHDIDAFPEVLAAAARVFERARRVDDLIAMIASRAPWDK